MKRQIDPNLSSNESENILFSDGAPKEKTEFKLTEKTPSHGRKHDDVEDLLLADNDKSSIKSDSESKSDADTPSKSEEATEHHHSNEHTHSHSGEHSHHHHSEHSHHHSSGSHHHHGEHSHHHSSSSHHHSSHRHSHKKKSKMPKLLKVIIIIILIIALILGGTGIAYTVLKNEGKNDLTSVAQTTDLNEIITYNGHKYQYNENIVPIAFMGIDERELEYRDEYVNNLGCADADMVAAINTVTGEMKVIAVPRDTVVDIDIYSSSGVFLKTQSVQLTISYAYGDGKEQSCNNVTKAMSRILYNVPIDKYFALDLSGIAPLNDAVGGVTLTPTYSIPDKGIQEGVPVTLKGDMAEAYVRTRDMDHATSALERGDRQVQYVKAFADALLPVIKKDFGVVSDLYNTAKQYSQTNLSLNNVTYLASVMLSNGITNFKTYTLDGTVDLRAPDPSKPDYVNAYFTPDEDKLMQTVLDVFYTQID